MASNMYMKLGPIAGESEAKEFAGQIEVHSFSYNCSQSLSPVRSGGMHTQGRANHGLFHFTKIFDSSSAAICQYLWNGKTMTEDVVFTVVAKSGNDTAAMKYMVLTLSNCVIASYSINGGGDIPYEEVSLNFAKIKVEYDQQKQTDGTSGGKKIAFHDLTKEESGDK